MTAIDTEPNWDTPAPPEAVLATVDAIASAAVGDSDGCCIGMASFEGDARWLVIVAVDTLAALGRSCQTVWTRHREQLHTRAVELGADDEDLRVSLRAAALAEARDRRADLRVAELESDPDASPHDLACAAAQLAGQLGMHVHGDHFADRLQAARKLFGDVP